MQLDRIGLRSSWVPEVVGSVSAARDVGGKPFTAILSPRKSLLSVPLCRHDLAPNPFSHNGKNPFSHFPRSLKAGRNALSGTLPTPKLRLKCIVTEYEFETMAVRLQMPDTQILHQNCVIHYLSRLQSHGSLTRTSFTSSKRPWELKS